MERLLTELELMVLRAELKRRSAENSKRRKRQQDNRPNHALDDPHTMVGRQVGEFAAIRTRDGKHYGGRCQAACEHQCSQRSFMTLLLARL